MQPFMKACCTGYAIAVSSENRASRPMATQNPTGISSLSASPTPIRASEPTTVEVMIRPDLLVTKRLTSLTEEPPIIWATANTAAAMPAR
jgi:hypothetical protein